MSDSDTRRRMVEAASRLFQSSGYRGTSWRTLVRASGTPWGSIQHHFPGGKEELGVAAVEHGTDLLGQFLASCFDGSRSPADALTMWFEASAGLLAAGGYVEGCPVAAVAFDADSSTEGLRAACAKAFGTWTGIVAGGLRAAGLEEARAQSLAVTAVAAFEGALLMSRTLGSVEPLRQTSGSLGELLSS